MKNEFFIMKNCGRMSYNFEVARNFSLEGEVSEGDEHGFGTK